MKPGARLFSGPPPSSDEVNWLNHANGLLSTVGSAWLVMVDKAAIA